MDDTQDFDKLLEEKVSSAQKLEKLTSLTLAATRAIDGVISPERRNVLAPFVETVEQQHQQCRAELAEAQQARQDCLTLRRAQEDALEIPADGEADYVALDFKQLKSAVGELRDDNKHLVKLFCHKLKTYGESNDWQHATYKVALSLLLSGELHDQYIHQNHKPLPEILQWFYDVYHRPDTLADIENSLSVFQRNAKEPIIICMKRYLLLADRADLHLPANMKHYSTERHLTKILISLVLEPAKTSLQNFVSYQLQQGVSVRYQDILQEADRKEKRYRCVPTTQINLVDADMSLATVSFSQLAVADSSPQSTSSDPAPECNTAVRRDKSPRPSPYSVRNRTSSPLSSQKPVDPVKHTGNRPSFYNSRDSVEKKVHFQAPPSGRSPGFVRKQYQFNNKFPRRKFNQPFTKWLGGFTRQRNNGEYPPSSPPPRPSSQPIRSEQNRNFSIDFSI